MKKVPFALLCNRRHVTSVDDPGEPGVDVSLEHNSVGTVGQLAQVVMGCFFILIDRASRGEVCSA